MKGETRVTGGNCMRQRILLVLVVFVAIIPLATGHAWRPAVGASSVVPGQALADIQLGAPIGDVLNRFGTPSAVRLTGSDGLLGYGFDRYGITVYAHGDTVQAVSTTNSVIGGVNGIALGTPLTAVVRDLGQTYAHGVVEGYPGVVYTDAGVAFGIDHDSVAAILVFRPATAMPGQPTTPAGPVTSHAAPPAASPATSSGSAGLPDVSHLRAYTVETHFLSLSGYLRYLVHDSSKKWMTNADTDRLMRQAGDSGQP